MVNNEAGFSLLELLLVLVLVGVLLVMAVPTWQQHQWLAGRQQAWLQLQGMGLQQQMWHLQHGVYFDDAALLAPIPETTRYDYLITLTGSGYLLSATIKANGPQARDLQCQRLTLAANGEVKSYGSNGESDICR
ncbi:MAG: prepilin-type N-terminal cleavage/methylation domain-containing protein [Oceanospirillaceae bacterium]|jgi:type IV pilus assembly protein PilE|nr:prepilin-type N-terminal cleavage/methylation domain-containing protein [Oceanospirillaceae bacterium]MBT4442393.1 prepilin-type N-terminal cleavage/methylation domain-containing protein [Oceanospirillaceae bacterium]MBT6076750.1 prepilin-type N-terminal cleavage/methylation domain-containing protein [Oceanospirillaceae bacterium]MBT7330242.1 prepilin-type N-terminal cleavage/methylation domain-containing protein [Oceanospirillaceae bacterium]